MSKNTIKTILFALLVTVFGGFFSTLSAQEMTVVNFRYDESDNTASDDETMEFDQNGDVCAVIKIQTSEKDFAYDVGSLGIARDPIYKQGEIWLYVPFGIKRITLRHSTFGTCEYAIPVAIESGKTYVMKLSTTGGKEIDDLQDVEIAIEPENATLFVDDIERKLNGGIFKTQLELGEHSFSVKCSGYNPQEGRFDLKAASPYYRNVLLVKEGEEEVKEKVGNEPRVFMIAGTNIKFTMIPVHGGTFTQGATPEQEHSLDDERPTHSTTLDDYYIAQTEVTQELWEAVMEDNPSYFKGSELPVEQVSWNSCRQFIMKLSALLGQKFRMPTEAEWEFAARGGSSTTNQYGSTMSGIDDMGWYMSNSARGTHTVATKEPNGLGLYDMCGNVREWVSDTYAYYDDLPKTNPKGASTGAHKVCRGGSWMSNSWNCRTSYRDINPQENTDKCTGLRLAM